MTIGLPQPRVLLVIRALAVCAAIAGCGGGAQMRKTRQRHRRAPAKAAARARTAPQVTPHDSGVDHPGTPVATLANGDACTSATACQSGFCVDGVCCESACTGACLYCASADSKGKCVPADLGTNPRDPVQGPGPDDLWNGRLLRRHRRLREVPGRRRLPDGRVHGRDADVRRPLRRRGHLRRARQPVVRAVHLRHGRAVQDDVLDGHRLRAPDFCVSGSCGKKPIGASCGTNADCNSAFCAAGRLLRDRLHRDLQVVRGPGERRHLHQRSGRAGPAGPVRRPRTPPPAWATASATARAPARSTRRAPLAAPAPAPARRSRPPASATAPVRAAPGTPQTCNQYACGTGGTCKSSCTADTDCSSGYFCVGGSCAKKGSGATCTTDSDCGPATARRGSAARRPAPAPACPARCRTSSGTCTAIPVGHGPATTSAPIRRRPTPAGPAAPATATARAPSTRPGPTAAPPPARGRR